MAYACGQSFTISNKTIYAQTDVEALAINVLFAHVFVFTSILNG